jgi:hypothetical protein
MSARLSGLLFAHDQRTCSQLLAALVLLLASSNRCLAESNEFSCPSFSFLHGSCCESDQNADSEKEDEPKRSYGPCCCEPRKTLMQWSCGTSFSGGPASMDEPLEANRPGFTISAKTVGRGVVQLESGYTFTLDNHAGERHIEHDFPDTLWRIGMFAEWFEWDIEYNYSIIDNTAPNLPFAPIHRRIRGSDDLNVGFKLCLTPQEGILPAMGLQPQMTVPSGSPDLTAGEVRPGILWPLSWEINKKVTVQMLTSANRARDDDGNVYTQVAQAISVSFQLSKQLECYAEWFVLSPTGRTIDRTQHYSDGGFAYHVTNNLQLDAEAGVGLNEAANDFFAGAGVVLRF